MQAQAAAAVLLKGGHRRGGSATDWLLRAGSGAQAFSLPRIPTANSYGTGCTLAAAIATLYPKCHCLTEAVGAAKAYLHRALMAARNWRLGQGRGR